MEKFLFICGCVVFVALILFFVFMCIEELRYLLAKKHFERVTLLNRIHQCESDLSCFRIEFENTIEDLEELIKNQNILIKHQLKLISKKIKDWKSPFLLQFNVCIRYYIKYLITIN